MYNILSNLLYQKRQNYYYFGLRLRTQRQVINIIAFLVIFREVVRLCGENDRETTQLNCINLITLISKNER